MPLGTDRQKRRLFLNFKDGALVHKEKDGTVHLYDYAEGYLRSITTPTRTYGPETVKVWNFELEDPETGDIYVLSTSYPSGIAKSLLLSLASPERLGLVRVSTYLKNDYPRVNVSSDGERLEWKYKAEDFPPIEVMTVGGKEVRLDDERMKFFERVAEEVRAKLESGAPVLQDASSPPAAPHDDVPPPPLEETPYAPRSRRAPSRGSATPQALGMEPRRPAEVDLTEHRAGEPDGLPF